MVNSDTLVTWRLGKATWAAIGILGAKLGATKAGAKLGAKLRAKLGATKVGAKLEAKMGATVTSRAGKHCGILFTEGVCTHSAN